MDDPDEVIAGPPQVCCGCGAGSLRHIRAGRWYYPAISVVFITAAILAAMRWRQAAQV